MSQKILTVSIAAYQVEKYIRQALDSLLDEETADRLEVFVIDDGGADATLEIARSYEERFPGTVYAVHKENGGYGSTLNYGIGHASGKYFKQLDGDDWFEKKNLKGFLNFLEKAEADLVLTPYDIVYSDRKPERIDRHRLPGETNAEFKREQGVLLESFRKGELQSIRLHELAVRTAILQENSVTLSEKRFYTDNEYVFFPCLYADSITRYPETLYCYRLGEEGQSVSLQGRIKHWTDAEDIIVRLGQAYEERAVYLCEAVRESLMDQLCEMTLFQMANYIVFPDQKEAYQRCRGFRERICIYKELCREAGRKYPLVKGMMKAGYAGFCVLRRYYAGRIH